MAKKTTSPDSLSCPNCGHQIAIGELMQHQVAEQVRAEMKGEVTAAQEEITRRERQLAEDKAKNTLAVEDAVRLQVAEMEKKARTSAIAEFRGKLESLQDEVTSKNGALATAHAVEVSLRREKSELEDRAAQLDVEVARRVDEERQKIGQQVAARVETEHRLQLADRDRQLSTLGETVAVLQRKLEQGSQQAQGEVLELEIEDLLRAAFPLDTMVPVPKGVNGADIIQMVVARSGRACGSIIWELKRTKNFNQDWIGKLKADQRVAKCEVAILVSTVLPEGVKSFDYVDGVWVCGVEYVVALATAMGHQLRAVASAVVMESGKKDKAELVYEYLAGQGFRQRIEAIVEAFSEIKADLAEERRVQERRWAKREKQADLVIASTSGMYGDLQGMIGSSLTEIKMLGDGK